jgi:hypothetical protein
VLLTFGTVLRRLYGRIFPLYFSPGAFAAVARRLGEPARATVPVDGDRAVATALGSDGSRAVVEVDGDPGASVTSSGAPLVTSGVGPWGADQAGWVSPSLRWRNLWRRTDYLGGRVGNPLADAPPAATGSGLVQIDVEFTDPQFLPGRGDSTMPAAGRHSNFPRDPDFQAQLMGLIQASFASLDPAGGDGLPTAPIPPSAPDDLMNPRDSMG